MPRKRSAYKEKRKSEKRRFGNIRIASEAKTLIKKYNFILSEKKFDQAKKLLSAVSSGLNKAAKRGVIHKNTASRKISRLSKKLHKAAAAKK